MIQRSRIALTDLRPPSLLPQWLHPLLWLVCSSSVWVILHASTTTTLYSIAELQSSLKSASVGDHFILADGHYRFNGTLLIGTDGLTLSAQSAGGVVFVGCHLNIKIKSDDTTVSGIQFINSYALDQRNIMDIFGSHNHLVDLNFDGCSADKYICIRAGSVHNTIQKSNFQNKPISSTTGNLIEIQVGGWICSCLSVSSCVSVCLPACRLMLQSAVRRPCGITLTAFAVSCPIPLAFTSMIPTI